MNQFPMPNMSLVPYVVEQTSRGERSYDIFFQASQRQDCHAD